MDPKTVIISLLIGYCFGMFLTADLVALKYTGHNASKIGTTGNPGMANIMANLGMKAGLIVLVGDLVTLSRLDEGPKSFIRENFSVSNAAWEIAETYRPWAKASQKKFDAEIQEGVAMYGNKDAVQRMFSVLLDNAIRYSDPEGQIRFSVAKKRGKVWIEVFNTCRLETPPDVDLLFDRFYRPDESRSTETGGTGVGLAVAKAVAEAYNGTISASCPDGTSMTITAVI